MVAALGGARRERALRNGGREERGSIEEGKDVRNGGVDIRRDEGVEG